MRPRAVPTARVSQWDPEPGRAPRTSTRSLLVDEATIADAAGAPATLQALLVAVGLAVVMVVPALGYLYKLTQSEAWSRHGS